MSLSSIAEEKPYLKDVIELYMKIREFEELGLENAYASAHGAPRHYVGEDVGLVFGEFSRIFGIPPDDIAPLREAMGRGELDLLAACSKENADEDAQPSVLYILSRPFFRALLNARQDDAGESSFEEGRCPVCSSVPSVSVLEKNSMRQYHCTVCGAIGQYRRIGCPNCRTEHPKDLDIIFIEDDRSIRVDTCNKCQTYFKSIDSERLHDATVMEHDIISLPLDVVAQQKGYARRSPNPVGIVRIST